MAREIEVTIIEQFTPKTAELSIKTQCYSNSMKPFLDVRKTYQREGSSERFPSRKGISLDAHDVGSVLEALAANRGAIEKTMDVDFGEFFPELKAKKKALPRTSKPRSSAKTA